MSATSRLTAMANRIHRFGPPDVIEFQEIERPVPGTGEVLVRVSAAGVGPWDAWVRAGRSAIPQPLPLTLGSDIAGTVEAAGDGVRDVQAGTDVFGVTNQRFTGGYATYAVASASMLAPAPRGLNPTQAAAAPVVTVTAHQMLFDHARLAAGQTVLVQGAAGSVGASAVQLARAAGARVVATTLSRDVDYVRSLGADEVIDASRTPFETIAHDIDAVIDTLGGDVQRKSFGVLRRGGVLVSSVSPPDEAEAARLGIHASFFLVDVTAAALARVAALMEAGTLTVRVGTVLPLAEGRQAHEMLEGQRQRPPGKIVLRTDR